MSHRCCIVLIVSLRNYYFCWEKYSKIHDEEKLYVFPETNKKEPTFERKFKTQNCFVFSSIYTSVSFAVLDDDDNKQNTCCRLNEKDAIQQQ